MRLKTSREFVTCLSKGIDIYWRIKGEGHPWTLIRLADNRLDFNLTMFDYYVDCPVAMWADNIYKQLMQTEDLRPMIEQSHRYDPFGDYWEYSGFIKRVSETKSYHVRMGYDGKWVGIWEVENVN